MTETTRTDSLSAARRIYIDLLKRCLVNSIYPEYSILSSVHWKRRLGRWLANRLGYELVKPLDPRLRALGKDWPLTAHTMIGSKRLDNIQFCVEDVLRTNVPGDFMETGVWRGGACILMRGLLNAFQENTRKVWVVDSFEGLPKPSLSADDALLSTYTKDNSVIAVSLGTVKDNFARYGLLDEQVVFLKGWFKDTLPSAPVSSLAVLRLDGDLYESTMDVLKTMYPKLSMGGYLIVDDYSAIDACKKAVDEYRAANNITEAINKVDDTGVYWQKATK